MTSFTPWPSLLGGMLIGLSSVICILYLGKIAGISGIVGRLWQADAGDRGWRWAFVAGLVLAPLLTAQVHPLPVVSLTASPAWLVVAGLLVGFGSRLGSGCTSGHGVCGLARRSPRSLAATLTFMLVAMCVVWLVPEINPI